MSGTIQMRGGSEYLLVAKPGDADAIQRCLNFYGSQGWTFAGEITGNSMLEPGVAQLFLAFERSKPAPAYMEHFEIKTYPLTGVGNNSGAQQ